MTRLAFRFVLATASVRRRRQTSPSGVSCWSHLFVVFAFPSFDQTEARQEADGCVRRTRNFNRCLRIWARMIVSRDNTRGGGHNCWKAYTDAYDFTDNLAKSKKKTEGKNRGTHTKDAQASIIINETLRLCCCIYVMSCGGHNGNMFLVLTRFAVWLCHSSCQFVQVSCH